MHEGQNIPLDRESILARLRELDGIPGHERERERLSEQWAELCGLPKTPPLLSGLTEFREDAAWPQPDPISQDAPDPPGLEAAETRRQTLLRVLGWLAAENDLRRIGWKCALAHWLIAQNESQTELAARLGVSKAAITQSLNAFRSEIAQCLQADDAP